MILLQRMFVCYGTGLTNITSRKLVKKLSSFLFSSETNSMK